MAAERTVVVRIKAEYRAFEASMKAAARAAEQASEKIDASGKKSSSALGQLLLDAKQHEQSWNVAGGAMLGFGAAVVGMVGVSVAKYAAFDKAMSSVRAATHASKGDMDALREAAIKAGADTAFSAEEAAKGIEELAKAGVETKDILGGGLAGALNLAAAGELAVGEAAEIAASAMTQFKLSGDQIPHLADLLAAGAGKAQGSVTDMGAALNQSGLVAASTGLTIEETTGALAAFASAGLTGSDAGTSFKTMLQSLNPNSDKAAAIMEDLGISAYDAGGEFIGMSEYAGKLQGALKDMSAEQRNATLKTLFGSDAVRAANVLYEQGAEGIQKWEDQVNAAGYAAQTAAIMQDNLAGDVEKLGGAFDTVFLKSGKGANDVLRGMVSRAEDVVDAVGKIPGPILSSVTGFAGIVGATALVAGGFMTLVPKAIETWGAFRDLGTAGSKIPGNFGKVTKAAGVAAGAFILLQAAVAANNATAPEAKGVEEFIDGYNKLRESATSMDDTFKNMEFAKGSSLEGKITNLGDALSELSPRFGDVGRHLGSFGATVLGAENGLPQMKREIEGLSDAMATAATGGDIEGASKVFREMVASAEAGGKGLADLTPYMGSYLDSLREIANQYGANISEGELMVWALEGIAPASVAAAQGAESAAAGLEEIGVSAEGAVTELDKLVQAMFAMSDGTLNVRAATRGFQEAIDGINESIKENGKSLDETTPKGRANAAALDAVAQGGKDIATAMSTAKDANGNFVHTQDEVQASLKGTYDATYAAARAFGLGKTESAALARELLGIPKDVSVDTWIADTAKNGAEATRDAVNGIPGMKNVSVIVTDKGSVSVTQEQIQGIKDRTIATTVTDEGTILTVQGGINNIEGTTEQILVNDNGTVQVVQAKINNTTGKTEYIKVTDGGTVAGVQAKINSIADGYAQIRVTTIHSTEHVSTGVGGRGGITRASGGSVFGAGTETSDSIPAWLSNNEHVLSAKEVRGLGGHGAVERLRAEARMGNAPAFKAGGRVGDAEQKVTSLKRAYEKIDGKKDNKPRKLAAKWAYEDAKKELAAIKAGDKKAEAAAKKSSEARKKAAEDEKARQGRLGDLRYDLNRDIRRGEITDGFTSGSGLSTVDRLFDLSRNKDLSKGARKTAGNFARSAESALKGLTKQAESLEKQAESAKKTVEQLLSVQGSVSGGLRGEFSLSGTLDRLKSVKNAGPLSAGSFVKSAQGKAAQIMRFNGLLDKLRKKGFTAAVIEEVAMLGSVEGTQVGNALLGATSNEKNALNKAYKSMDYWAGEAGTTVTKSMHKGGLDAAEGFALGIEGKQKRVEDAMFKLGKGAEKALRNSLDTHSPSRKLRGVGHDGGDGLALGFEDRLGLVSAAAGRLGDAAMSGYGSPAFSIPPSAEVARYAAQPAAAGFDYARLAEAVVRAAQAAPVQASINLDGRKFGDAIAAAQKTATRGNPKVPFLAKGNS